METLRTRIARLEQSAPKPAAAEAELSAEEIEERNRSVLERLRGYVEDGKRFAQLSPQAQLAELLAKPPSQPDPPALASDDLAFQLSASVHAACAKAREVQIKLLRARIAAEASDQARQGGTGREA